jgi:predicted glycogen debranching enzyme
MLNLNELTRRMPWRKASAEEREVLVHREWLVTNGLGGYASGTVAGVCTRRYHGLLTAAFTAPLGRTVMLNHLAETIRLPRWTSFELGGEERGGSLDVHGADYLAEFRLEAGLPVWRFEIEDIAIEKRLLLIHQQNTVHVTYRLVQGEGPVRLKLRPSIHFRPHEAPVSQARVNPYVLTAVENRFEISGGQDIPPLRLLFYGQRNSFTVDSHRVPEIRYRIEEMRGYEATGPLWTPGHFRADLRPGADATLVASTEHWEVIGALNPEEAYRAEMERRGRLLQTAPPEVRKGPAAELLIAADQFLICPVGRAEDAARARAAGDEMRSVIAGYHWFTDWGRDTMISLEGLTLSTGRLWEAGYILRTFAYYIRDGLIPNMFPEGQKEGLYHTADATLWFFHALHRYLQATNDRNTLRVLLPKLQGIVEHHLCGTRFGIHVDPHDGLLVQGQEGYQLTWMDAKVDGWVVTPRRGKAVELNALWYNALRLLEGWVREEQSADRAKLLAEQADKAQQSFNKRFWYPQGGHLYDVIDGEHGDDSACRPNQIFAISLDHPVLVQSKWQAVLEVVRKQLLTPVGLRSLAPGHPDYKAKYYGDLRARDAAYHQGTVWSWLIGAFIDGWLRVYPDRRAEARGFLQGLIDHLSEACIGSVSEIFDAEPPYTPRGCIAQAWGVAELLRGWLLTEEKKVTDGPKEVRESRKTRGQLSPKG